jgi:hypothetical protein
METASSLDAGGDGDEEPSLLTTQDSATYFSPKLPSAFEKEIVLEIEALVVQAARELSDIVQKDVQKPRLPTNLTVLTNHANDEAADTSCSNNPGQHMSNLAVPIAREARSMSPAGHVSPSPCEGECSQSASVSESRQAKAAAKGAALTRGKRQEETPAAPASRPATSWAKPARVGVSTGTFSDQFDGNFTVQNYAEHPHATLTNLLHLHGVATIPTFKPSAHCNVLFMM